MMGDNQRDENQTEEEARILAATEQARSAFASSGTDIQGERSQERARGLGRYLGTRKIDHKKGTSSVATREVTEAVEDLLPLILKPFVASDDVVAFDPQGPEDEEAAKQDADYVAHVFQNQCNGFFTLYTGAKDGLISRKGIAHIDIADTEKTVTRAMTGVTEEQLAGLTADDAVEILSGTSREEAIEVGPRQYVNHTLYDLQVSITERERKPEISVIAPELFVIDDDHDSLDPESASIVGHWYRTTYGELLEDGFDQDKLDAALGGGSDSPEVMDSGGEFVTRHGNTLASALDDQSSESKADREMWVLCVRLRLDVDDSGESRHIHAYISGQSVLAWEETDFIPYVQWSPFPVTHRAEGMSLDDMVGDLQDTSTQLTRQLLNNVQGVNYGRPVVNESVKLTDLTGRATGPIRVKGNAQPGAAFMRDAPPVMVGELLTALGRVDQMRESRSGYSKAMMGHDPSVMQQSTADAFARGMEQHNARTELMARIFGEMFVAGLFRKLHEVIRRYQDVPATVRLRGKWVTVDPREWAERKNVSVSVGIGYGTTDERMKQLATVSAVQEKLFAAGLVQPQHMHATARRMIELAGFKNHAEFLADPQQMAQQEQQPDPQQQQMQMQMQLAQVQIQTEQAKAQAAVMRAQVEAQVKTRELDLRELELQLKAKGENDKATADLARIAQEERNRTDRTAIELEQARAAVTAAELRVNGSLKETAMKLQNERLLNLPPEAFAPGDSAALDALAAEVDGAFAEQQRQADEFQKLATEAFTNLAGRMNSGRKIEMQRDANGDLVGASIDGRALAFTRDANGDLAGAEYLEE